MPTLTVTRWRAPGFLSEAQAEVSHFDVVLQQHPVAGIRVRCHAAAGHGDRAGYYLTTEVRHRRIPAGQRDHLTAGTKNAN